MSYEHDQLKQALANVLTQSDNNNYNMQQRMVTCENRLFSLEARVAELEAYFKKAKPYIDTFILIDSPEETGAAPCP